MKINQALLFLNFNKSKPAKEKAQKDFKQGDFYKELFDLYNELEDKNLEMKKYTYINN